MKLTLKLLIFATTFTIAFTSVTVMNKSFTRLFKQKKDLQSTVKVYNFLHKDKQLRTEWFEKLITSKIPERMGITKDWYEAKLTRDTSELPEDFRQAWEKRTLSEVILFRMIYNNAMKPEELTKEKIEARILLDEEYRSVAQDYGFELGEYGTLIEENK